MYISFSSEINVNVNVKNAPLDVHPPLRDLAVSPVWHKQHSLIPTNKVSHCLPLFQITKSKTISPATTNFTHPHISLAKYILF